MPSKFSYLLYLSSTTWGKLLRSNEFWLECWLVIQGHLTRGKWIWRSKLFISFMYTAFEANLIQFPPCFNRIRIKRPQTQKRYPTPYTACVEMKCPLQRPGNNHFALRRSPAWMVFFFCCVAFLLYHALIHRIKRGNQLNNQLDLRPYKSLEFQRARTTRFFVTKKQQQ